jgi:hypothetical protein
MVGFDSLKKEDNSNRIDISMKFFTLTFPPDFISCSPALHRIDWRRGRPGTNKESSAKSG